MIDLTAYPDYRVTRFHELPSGDAIRVHLTGPEGKRRQITLHAISNPVIRCTAQDFTGEWFLSESLIRCTDPLTGDWSGALLMRPLRITGSACGVLFSLAGAITEMKARAASSNTRAA